MTCICQSSWIEHDTSTRQRNDIVSSLEDAKQQVHWIGFDKKQDEAIDQLHESLRLAFGTTICVLCDAFRNWDPHISDGRRVQMTHSGAVAIGISLPNVQR